MRDYTASYCGEENKMQTLNWQLKFPIDAVVFDCDGTLSQIEGIDVLASKNGVGEQVHRLTELAMSEKGITSDLYENRISLVKPNRHQIIQLGQEYFDNRTPDIDSVVQIFRDLGKKLYIISAGVNPSVKIFGELLGILEKNIFAVKLDFDEQGNYLDYDRESPMSMKNGKRKVIERIKWQYRHILYVGDGMNDYEAHDMVDRFVGYGGFAYREHIDQLCDYYIKSKTMLPLLALGLTSDEVERLSSVDQQKYQLGLNVIQEGLVTVREERSRVN